MADSQAELDLTPERDIDAAVDRIGASLGEDYATLKEPTETPGVSTQPTEPSQPAAAQDPTPAPQAFDVPKSWKKEMHPHWGQLNPTVQGYVIEREKQLLDGFSSFRPVQDALTPHLQFLKQMNIEPHRAVDALLRAQRRLTEGTIEQRRAAYKELGQNLQLLEEVAQADPSVGQSNMDPNLLALRQQVEALQAQATAEREAVIAQIREENKRKIDAFAEDTKAHPYFDEVADDIARFVQMGDSLQDAYEKAVWVNPVTRAKEQARAQTEHEAKLKENARLAALPKKQAASVNLQSNGDGPELTEPEPSIEDIDKTIKSTHRKIKARA